MEGKLLTKEDIFQIEDLEIKEVYVEPWGGTVPLKTLTAKEREDYEWDIYNEGQQKKGEKKGLVDNMRAKLVAACAVNSDGSRMFTTEDVVKLSEKSAHAIEILYKECQVMNGMEIKAVEEVTGNLSEGQSGNSTSD